MSLCAVGDPEEVFFRFEDDREDEAFFDGNVFEYNRFQEKLIWLEELRLETFIRIYQFCLPILFNLPDGQLLRREIHFLLKRHELFYVGKRYFPFMAYAKAFALRFNSAAAHFHSIANLNLFCSVSAFNIPKRNSSAGITKST